jgi:hypothetical protein
MSEFDDIPRDIGPADLPAGETVLWRGRPDWRHLALDAFGAPWVALYFVGIGTWHLATTLHDGGSRADALAAASAVVVPLALALALVALFAWLSARATRFTLTDRRIVMRYGVALPALINVPLDTVEALRARRGFGDRGDIAFTLPRDGRLAFHQLWPYARPWHLFPATPMLRSVPKIDDVKALFLAAVAAAAERDALKAAVAAEAPRPASPPQGENGPGYGEAAPAAA